MKSLRWFALLLIVGVPTFLVAPPVHTLEPPGRPGEADGIVGSIAGMMDERVTFALQGIAGTDRRLLALRSYLRAGQGLAARWSWTEDQIARFVASAENHAMQAEIEKVRLAFAAANPGFQLWVNPDVRSLDTQLARWNTNATVSRAAANLEAAFRKWLISAPVQALPAAALPGAASKFLQDFVPSPTPTLAAPGLSRHGQMRAVDFQIRKGDRLVAGPTSATIAAAWDAPGWTDKLRKAVEAASERFSGPLAVPREPWHYAYE